jgi:hypothetical protein
MRRILLAALMLAAMFSIAQAPRVTAQILLVDNTYFVTELQPGKERIGVALSKGTDTQNWVHIKSDTKINLRKWSGKSFTDHAVNPARLFTHLKYGSKMRVYGGRAMDGSVVAKKIWL